MDNLWVSMRREVHSSWIIAVAACGIVCGVIASQNILLSRRNTWVMVAVLLLVLCFMHRRMYILSVALLAGGVIGLWRGGELHQTVSLYDALAGRKVTIQGYVSEDVELTEHNEVVIRLNVEQIDGRVMSGAVWIAADHDTKVTLQRSDIVTVYGKLSPGFGSFSASMYNATVKKVVHPEPGDLALRLRDYFADKIRMAIKEPEASLGIGYLVGQRRSLPEELDRALQIAGLTHIVVASGYNLTILVRLARRLFMKISKFTAAVIAGAMIVSFVAISGASPSMSRAGLVAGLSLFAWYYGRSFHPLVLLPFAAAITLLINPSFGWNDLGWQLSFAAFAGVMIVAPLMHRYFFGKKKPGTIRQIIGETIAAQICTLPLLLVAFGQLSNVALISNVLVLPLVPLAMLLTFVAGMGAIFIPFVAWVIGWPATTLLEYMISVARYFADLPWAQSEITMTIWMAILFYGGVVGCCLYAWQKTKFNLRETNLIE